LNENITKIKIKNICDFPHAPNAGKHFLEKKNFLKKMIFLKIFYNRKHFMPKQTEY
jgi:hypothetical protein